MHIPSHRPCVAALAVSVVFVVLALLTGVPAAEAQTAAGAASPSGTAAQPTATDIGRVSTGVGSEENAPTPVTPSETIDRSAAIEEKRQAPNITAAQPL